MFLKIAGDHPGGCWQQDHVNTTHVVAWFLILPFPFQESVDVYLILP